MSIDLRVIDLAIKNVEKSIEETALEAVSKLALTIDQTLVLSTPVDTGRARANWVLSISSPFSGIKEKEDKSGMTAITQASQSLSQYKIGDTIYLSNNLAYIGRLNDGSSKQAPAGFVEKAVDVARRAQ